MIENKNIEILQRFVKGLTSAKEEKYVYTLFTEKEENSDFKRYFQQEFDEYLKNHPEEDHNLSYLLDRIHHTIRKNESQRNSKPVKRILRWYSATAAVLLIPLLITGIIWSTSQLRRNSIVAEAPIISTLYAPMGSRVSFSLPDGTNGWLNSGSALEYKLPFSENRLINLKGEAWFDVAHDEEHPFEVFTGQSRVKVLGTKFNLRSFPKEKYLELVLEEGKVEFVAPGIGSGVTLKPNERLMMQENTINIMKTDASKYSGWKEGKLIFRGDAMDEVALRIGRWYNVDIEIVDKELLDYTFRGIFEDDSLEEVIRYISMTSPISYRFVKRKQNTDGTLQKAKVLLYMNKQ